MATLTVTDVDEGILLRLQQQAERNHRSLQDEVRWLLALRAPPQPLSWAESRALAARLRQSIPYSDRSIVEDIHEARAEHDKKWE
jgi:plasmid stability protein